MYIPKQDGTTVCQNDRWRRPGLASILPVCAAAQGDVREQLGLTRTDARRRENTSTFDFSKSFLI